MYFLSVKSLVPTITLISAAFARSARSAPKYNDTLPASGPFHTDGHKHAPHANTTSVAWNGGKGKGKGEDAVTVVTVVVSKPVTTICVTETSGSLSGSVFTYSTYTPPVSSKTPYSHTKASLTTSTILSTSTYTITSCAPTVTNCPVGKVTETVYTYTTVCPVSESSSSLASSGPYKNSSTIATSYSVSEISTSSGTVSLSSASGSVIGSTSSSVSESTPVSSSASISSSIAISTSTSSGSVSVSSYVPETSSSTVSTSTVSSTESTGTTSSSASSSTSVISSVSSATAESSSSLSSTTSFGVPTSVTSSSQTSSSIATSQASISSSSATSTSSSETSIVSSYSATSQSSSVPATSTSSSESSTVSSYSATSQSSSVPATSTSSSESSTVTSYSATSQSSSIPATSTSSSASSSVASSSATSKSSSASTTLTSSSASSSVASSSATSKSSSVSTTSTSSSASSSVASSSATSKSSSVSTTSKSSSTSTSMSSSSSSAKVSSSSIKSSSTSTSASKTTSSSVISTSSSSSSSSSKTSSSVVRSSSSSSMTSTRATTSSSSSSSSQTSSSSRTSATSKSSSSSLVTSTTSSSKSSSSSVSSTSSSSSKSSSSSSSLITSTSSSSKTSSTSSSTSSSATPTQSACYYWMENVTKQGIAPFNAAPGSYQVFRNVRDFGAKGDGITDDTAAIQLAISSGGRCAPGSCVGTTTTPAIVYFPSGTYLVSKPIIDYYYTQMIGNPNCLPVIKASSSWIGDGTARWVIDGDQYGASGLAYGATNVFWRQIRNFIIDLTAVPSSILVAGIHWPTAQATSLQNIVFKMSSVSGTQHEGIFCESGSGGFITDLTFYGGLHGVVFANQQFTIRNLTFYNSVTAIDQLFDWGWLYKGISINNCSIGIDMTSLSVGSLTLIDSVITNTPIGIATSKSSTIDPPTANTLIIENVQFNNVPAIVTGASSTLLAGSTGSITVAAWGQGHEYNPNLSGPVELSGAFTPNSRAPGLVAGADYYERSKPQYEKLPASSFVSVRSAGAKGDGVTDDSDVLIAVIASAAAAGKIVYFDAGYYLVTKTIYIPAGSRITGETYPVIMSSGAFFNDINNPQPVVQVGKSGETGTVEWSEMIVSTKGTQAGAILIQWNLAASGTPAGMWDVHTRIGGFAGSELDLANCPTTTTAITSANLPAQCIGAFMSMHITSSATGLYMENVWLWTADHEIENSITQISVFTGRGLLIESSLGNIWLYGTAVEHHALYQYQLVNTGDIFMGFIQTETPYYQPNPDALIPFPPVAAYSDPIFTAGASAWGLRIVKSNPVFIYGAGLYSFFSNYNVHCSDQGNGETCQPRIFSIEESIVLLYNLNTVGTGIMITQDGSDFANYSDNLDGFVDTIALYRS